MIINSCVCFCFHSWWSCWTTSTTTNSFNSSLQLERDWWKIFAAASNSIQVILLMVIIIIIIIYSYLFIISFFILLNIILFLLIIGIVGKNTLLKVSAATLSLFFACLLPCVAFGVVDANHTNQTIGPKEAIIGQAIGGLVFAFFSGQPLVIIATTAPLCLYTKVVHAIAERLDVKFRDLFAAVGLWNSFFLLIYSIFDLSQLMQFCTRSTEEIFATFIFFAFLVDALQQCADSKCIYCVCAYLANKINNTNTNYYYYYY